MNRFDYSMVKNPEYFKDNCMPAHSSHRYYSSAEAMMQQEESFKYSLNGLWKFHYAKNYESTVQGFEKEEYCCLSWDDIRVPAHIQMEGYDVPQYANVQYPWEGHEDIHPGEIPEHFNPVASYVKYFTVPEQMKGKRLFISFQGAESGIALWLNGQFVGYSEDSFTPSEFELTDYVKEGENKLAAQVFKWTASSWCEDQDFYRFSGIYREVYLYTVPDVHVYDLQIRAIPDESLNKARFEVKTSTWGKGNVHIVLSKKGQTILEENKSLGEIAANTGSDRNGKDVAAEATGRTVQKGVADTFSWTVENPILWSAEDPQLYDLVMEVFDENGILQEVIPQKVGFRRFEMKDGIMTLNGKRIVFKGVNRHEFSSITGRCVSEAELRKDLTIMKQNNINAIRTCHYPDASLIYQLCDEFGIYMIDETNLESHGSWDTAEFTKDYTYVVPHDKPEWQSMMLDRANSMYQRDKNHPAILIWSCGNESFGGKDIFEMSQLFRNADPTRLVHYEGVCHDRRYNATSDMESQMYTPVADIKKFLAEHPEKPFIMCEYSHAMGNSCGGITDYTEYAYEEPLYQGGFIWEYMDHGIAVTSPDGKPGFAYGGDFGDRPTDREFCVDGLVLPDRRNTPKMDAVKAAYAPLKITLTDTEAVIENRNLFTDLNAYDLVFASSVNGKPERRAVLRADCKPGGTEHIPFPFALPEAGLACMTVTAIQRAALPGIPAGYEAALGQVWHNYAVARLTLPAPQLVEMDCNVGVKGEGFEYIFGRGKGLVSIRYNGVQLLDDTVRPNFWRAPTNNDEGCAEPFTFAFWKTAGLYARCDNLTAETKGDFVIARANYTLPDGQTLPIDFAIDGAGRCDITMTWQGTRTELPEFGLLFPLRRELTEVSYLGLGPRETTADRTAGGKMGAWNYNVRQDFAQNTPVYPQECGSRTGVYSATVTGSGLNIGIGFAGDGMTFSALPYTPHELENARHLYELPRDDNKTVVRCAAFQRGVGGDNSWGAKPHADACFAVEKGTSFRFTIQK